MLVSECIRRAYREANINVIGDTPSNDQNTEALGILNAFWKTVLGHEFGENLTEWPVPATGCIPDSLVSSNQGLTWYLQLVANVRVLLGITVDTTLTFPLNPRPGARISTIDTGSTSATLTLNGNGRLIEGQTQLVDDVTNQAGKSWFYRDDLASWEPIVDMELANSLPLPADFDDLFITYAALRLCGPNGADPPEMTAVAYKDVLGRARARYRQEMATAISDPRVNQTLQSPMGGVSWFE